MLVTRFYDGQGLGNQLWAYVVTRTLALDKGYEFGFGSIEKFKGHDFLNLDFGRPVENDIFAELRPYPKLPKGIYNLYIEDATWNSKFDCDVTGYDEKLLCIPDNTFLSGYFQSEKYIEHRKSEIAKWLSVDKKFHKNDFSEENICILNIRGGEYKNFPDLILNKEYWLNSMDWMRKKNCKMTFISITDDVLYAKNLLPEVPAHHFSIGSDYSIINRAKNLVLSNSSFAFFPAWTNLNAKNIIAPKYWARHNVSDGFWACEFNIYKNWNWLGRDGKSYSHLECQAELNAYKAANLHFFTKQILSKKGVVHNLYIKTKDFLSLHKKKFLHR